MRFGGTAAARAEGAQLLNSSQNACERRGPMGMKNVRFGEWGLFLSASRQNTPAEQRGGTVGGLLWLS